MENGSWIKEVKAEFQYSAPCSEARILQFLADVAVNNRRDWFQEHHDRYEEVRRDIEKIAERLIAEIATFDPKIGDVPVKATLYRFYRDTRFSLDKSPYKRHIGCYINSCGKKSAHGGYYVHFEPGTCMIGGGAYCLESPVLKAVRQSIIDHIDEFRSIVEAPQFKSLFPVIGESHLKTMPVGFPRDFAYPEYLRPKNYAVLHSLPDDFFFQSDWIQQVGEQFRVMKPFLDFVNETIDDYL